MTIRKAAKNEAKQLKDAVNRALELYDKLSKAKVQTKSAPRGLRAPDQRDLAQLIFFDVASQFEAFCVSVFALELRKLYRVRDHKVVERMMSNVDGGAVQGYAVPDRLIRRAEILLGKTSPWTRISGHLGQQVLDYLEYAHTIRNFIAHAGIGKGRDEFHKLLQRYAIPKSHRKGLGAGRLLLDYKDSTGKVWFKALLENYVKVGDYIAQNLR